MKMKKMILGVLLSSMMAASVGAPAFAAADLHPAIQSVKTTPSEKLQPGEVYEAKVDGQGVSVRIVKLQEMKIGKYTYEEFQKLSKEEQAKVLKEAGIEMVEASDVQPVLSHDGLSARLDENGDVIQTEMVKDIKIGEYSLEDFQKLSKAEQDKVLKEAKVELFKLSDLDASGQAALSDGFGVTVGADGMTVEANKDIKIGKYTLEEFQKLSPAEQAKVLEEAGIKLIKAEPLQK